MADGRVSDYGVLRDTHLCQCRGGQGSDGSQSASSGGKGSQKSATSGKGGAAAVDPASMTPEDVAALQQAAAQGDQSAIDLLKLIGGVAGVGAGVYALSRIRRGGRTAKSSGPSTPPMEAINAADVPGSTSRAVAPYEPPVTRVYDEQVIPRGGEPLPRKMPAPALMEAMRAARRLP